MGVGSVVNANSLRLRRAIQSNDIALVDRLLHASPQLLHNPDHSDKANTSLHLAAQAGHAELVVSILQKDHEITATNVKQELLISKGHDSFPAVTDLIYSNSGNNLGISVNTDGYTPLHLAASRHHVDVIEILCREFPSTIDRGDKQGRTPLLLAAARQAPIARAVAGRKNTLQNAEDVRAIDALIRSGADVRAQDHEGNTCLHQACAWGNLKTARALVQAGADPVMPNYKGFPPEAYSLTVQADVYFRNLVAEFEKRQAEEAAKKRERRAGGGGHVRLVENQEDDDENEFYDADESRSRANSGRSNTTSETTTTHSSAGLGVSSSRRIET